MNIAIERADTVLTYEDASMDILPALLLRAARLSQILIKGEENELPAFNIEVEDEVVATLVELVVVDVGRLVEQNLFASGLNGSHDLLAS